MNLSVTSQLITENQFPDCVFVKLHNNPAQPPASFNDTIDLQLTIRFGQQEIKVPGGCIWFGLKRGELKLELRDGKIPLEKMGLIAAFEPELEVEAEQERSREGEVDITLSGGIKTKDTTKHALQVKHKTCQVYTRGTEEAPVWVFEVKTAELILQGQLTETQLGAIEARTRPCGVRVTFEVRGQSDICLTEAEGLWAKDIGRNKKALLEREFFKRFIAPQLQPYLSQVKGRL